MLILAFDPSKSTGWAIYDTARDLSAIECGLFQMPEGAKHYFTADQIGRKVVKLLTKIKDDYKCYPDFVVLEEQSLAKIGNTSADAMLYPWIATTAIVSTVANFGIAYGTIPVGTWHTMFYGKGFKPPQKTKNVKGTPKLENDWKSAAVSNCERHSITLPTPKSLSHNAAEACALAICWRGAKAHSTRMQNALMSLLQRRNERAAA